MPSNDLSSALNKLKEDFYAMYWQTYTVEHQGQENDIHPWPGKNDEDIMIVNYQYSARNHIFHRHDYFYFNYCYKGVHEYSTHTSHIVMQENDVYAGQPFVSHRHEPQNDPDAVLVCLFIKPELVYRTLLPYITTSPAMTNFLIEPSANRYSEDSMHFHLKDDYTTRKLLEVMIIEYANKTGETQGILRSLASAFIMQMARKYTRQKQENQGLTLVAQMVKYIGEHIETVSLKSMSDAFSYHPNYVSNLLKKETGKTFTEIVLEQRMERAVALLHGTNLAVDSVSAMVGYSNPSNFHKAFRRHYNKSPREYINEIKHVK